MSKALSTCTHVFVRSDVVRKPLQSPYNGPYRVVDRKEKYFILDLNGRKDTVSIDRLKPAHLDDSNFLSEDQVKVISYHFTRSGRHVHFPKHLWSCVP